MRLLYAVEPLIHDAKGNTYRVIAQFRYSILVRAANGLVFFADFDFKDPRLIEVDFSLE